eukprot:GHVL01032583.1.p1 GENE.GHVL01032583.1~~GHVL01032583.1.p1  ORF type:complete len:216 (-),score=14.84 GHVL01032583.1:158-805(-)
MADEANTPNLRLCKLRRFTGEGDCAETFIQEAKLILQLQTVPALAAAAWILGALDGRARQEVIRRPAAEVNTPAKIYSILEQTWGDQRDSVALAAAFHRRQQGLGESVSEYASHLRAVWAKTNAAEANTLNDNTLLKTLATGLHPQSLQRDMCRFLREKPAATFDEVLFCGCVTLMELCGAHLVSVTIALIQRTVYDGVESLQDSASVYTVLEWL